MSQTLSPFQIRLAIVTDDAGLAALTVFHRDPEFIPSWAVIADDLAKQAAIPKGMAVIALWFGLDDGLRRDWIERRVHGSYDCDLMRHLDRVRQWRERRWASVIDPPAEPLPASAPAAPQSSTPAAPRKSRWH